MNHILLPFILVIVCFASSSATAQLPEKIYGKNKVLKSNDYYLRQISLWKKEIDSNPTWAEAWLNYYRANRNAQITSSDDEGQQAKGLTRFERLNNIVDEMERYIPDSYEYHFARWLNGNNDISLLPHLEQAHALAPATAEPIMHLMFSHEFTGDSVARDSYAKRYLALGEYSPGLLNYGYNVLASLEQNAIVFTEGDKDTEAMLLLTRGGGYRPDVRVLNVNLLLMPEYRARVCGELGIPPLDFEPLTSEEEFENYQRLIIKRCAENSARRPVYVSVTVSDPYIRAIEDDLYLIGLAYLYSTTPVDAIPVLKHNVEEVFLLDYLLEYFSFGDISIGNVRSMNANYLHPFSALHRHYQSIGDGIKTARYKQRALKIATEADMLSVYRRLFDE